MSNLDIYSPYKFVHHQDKITEMRAGVQPVPLQVQLIISDLCNHNCSFCAYRLDGYTSNKNFGEVDPLTQVVNNNPNRMIPVEKVMEILEDCKDMGVKAMQFTGGGEPTAHPKHAEIFQKTIDLGLDLSLVTNGTILKDKAMDALVDGKWVRFSLDADLASTYASIREVPESYFDRTVDNIRKLVKKKKNEKSNLVIGIGFVVTQENYFEILDSVEFWSNEGVDNIRISAVFTEDNYEYHKPIFSVAKMLSEQAVKMFDKPGFKVFNLYNDRIHDLKLEQPDYQYCGYMNLNTYIGGDQKVYTCCNNAYNDIGEIGSLKDQSFRELWESQEKEKFFSCFDAGACDRCMFNNKNKFINYVISDDAPHKNYI